MKKTLVAMALALFLVIAPMSIPAQAVCLDLRIVDGRSVCIETPLDPLIEPLIPAPLKPTENPPPKPPSKPNPTKSQAPSNNGSQGDSDGSKATPPRKAEPTPAQRTAAAEKRAKEKKKEERAKLQQPTPTVEPGGIEPPDVEYRFETYPWYFWVTIIFGILGVGFLLFYDTDPDKNGQSLIDKARKRVLK